MQTETIDSNVIVDTFSPGPKLAELVQAEVFHGVQVANELDEDTTLARFNDVSSHIPSPYPLCPATLNPKGLAWTFRVEKSWGPRT